MTTEHTPDPAKMRAFVGRVLRDTSGLATTVMAGIGDRLGLFKDLAANGPATSDELATRTGINERYAREWLRQLTSAGYLEYDPATGRFSLPPEHAPVLAEEGHPNFFGGMHQALLGNLTVLDRVVEAFRHGGGVPLDAYPEWKWDGTDRATAGWFEHRLVQEWLPAMPEVRAKLERGADLADVGCGRGRALIKLALAFPKSRYVGFDVFTPTIERATKLAEAAGVADRVRFVHRDAVPGLPGQFDVITTFDVVHDAVDPLGLLRAIHRALRSDGRYVCLDVNCSDKVEENTGPVAAMLYGSSILYCLTTSLAHGGAGLGALGLPESKVQELWAEAGFSSVRKVPLKNPVNNLYEAIP